MPYFTRQVDASGALMLEGWIGVTSHRQNALFNANEPCPAPILVRMMVDTGASCTCVDESILRELNLQATGIATINTPTTGSTPVLMEQYDVSLTIIAQNIIDPLHRSAIPVISTELFESQQFHVLLGRDVLSGCILIYDGQNGEFKFGY